MSVITKSRSLAQRLLLCTLTLVLGFSCAPSLVYGEALDSSQASEVVLSAQEDQASIQTQARLQDIGSGGNVTLTASAADIESAFAYGDILSVSFLGKTIEMPLCTSYSDVDAGKPVMRVHTGRGVVLLAINAGDFATTYGMAIKQDDGSSITWVPVEGGTDPVDVTISMHEAGGYYDEYVMRQLTYTDDRADYPNLTDDEFANFRKVLTTGIRDGILYRSASPIDPSRNRNTYVDAALRREGIVSILNLADSEADAAAFPGYSDSYYASVPHLALAMGYDFHSPENAQKTAQGMRFIANNPGPYDIHCLEGKDRTGYFVALLECLMGASLDEVVHDYMLSFQNYFGVTPNERRYEVIANGNIVTTLKKAFNTEDLTSTDLSKAAEQHLVALGVTTNEIAAIKHNLGPLPTYTVSFDLCGHASTPIASQTVSEGKSVSEPAPPSEEGFSFAGWFQDRDYTQAYDFSSPVTSDLVLYAKWVAKELPTNAATDNSGQSETKQAQSTTSNQSGLPKTDDPWRPRQAMAYVLAGVALLLCGITLKIKDKATT